MAGVRVPMRHAATKTFKLQLYTGTTVLQTITLDTDIVSTSNPGIFRNGIYFFDETTLATLTGGSQYRVGIQAQETAANLAIRTLDMAAAADLDAYPFGTAWFLSTRADAGTWSDDTTKRPLIELIIANSGGGIPTFGGMLEMGA
jgi:hypothetical protein